MIPMSMKAAFDRLADGHKNYVAVMLKRALTVACPVIIVGGGPSLDEAFNMLGRAITRRDLLKDFQKKINECMGYDFIIRKIEGVHDLIEVCDKEIVLINKMIQALLQKEVPYVVRDSSKGLDVPVQLQSK